MIDELLLTQIEEYVFAVYGNVRLTEEDTEPILALTLQDKKNRGGKYEWLCWMVPEVVRSILRLSNAEMRRDWSFTED